MICILCGTNRLNSSTGKIATIYSEILSNLSVEHTLVDLAKDFPQNFQLSPTMYHKTPPDFAAFQEKYLVPPEKFIILLPEYNGLFPGIFKLIVDLSDIKRVWNYKKICLVGIASGRGGNLRGLDAMSNAFHYLKAHVLPNKLPLSLINTQLDAEGNLTQEATRKAIEQQIQEFLVF
ncbi:MAG: NAD(P)H-dependent oxidoreductase [Chitinophagales bacterium]|nr:NAD(P)H-dependent oxidoreductase [Bacteroidota bacterium]MCB9042495.1 NAD(P)H-dependent oxidoreductase [Chitinophagales bacterium]